MILEDCNFAFLPARIERNSYPSANVFLVALEQCCRAIRGPVAQHENTTFVLSNCHVLGRDILIVDWDGIIRIAANAADETVVVRGEIAHMLGFRRSVGG